MHRFGTLAHARPYSLVFHALRHVMEMLKHMEVRPDIRMGQRFRDFFSLREKIFFLEQILYGLLSCHITNAKTEDRGEERQKKQVLNL